MEESSQRSFSITLVHQSLNEIEVRTRFHFHRSRPYERFVDREAANVLREQCRLKSANCAKRVRNNIHLPTNVLDASGNVFCFTRYRIRRGVSARPSSAAFHGMHGEFFAQGGN